MSLNRRTFLGSTAAGMFLPATRLRRQDADDAFVIDLDGAPDSLVPATSYSTRDWSIIHSIYDALLAYDDTGSLVPLAAESFESSDAITFKIVLRRGRTFHDGTAVTTAAIERAVKHLQGTESQVVDNFRAIDRVDIHDDLHADIVCSSPSPWLPAQIAVWMVLLPETATPDTMRRSPVGNGPYVFDSAEAGSSITLRRNPDYPDDGPKGIPLAETVIYRFVPDPTTRVADVVSGAADIADSVPVDQTEGVSGSASVVDSPVMGIAFVRIATDTPPFDKPEVRKALNMAIDVNALSSLDNASPQRRLASVFPNDQAIGFDPDLEPFTFDPDAARELLKSVGVSDARLDLEVVASSRTDVAEAIAAQLGEINIETTIVTSELAAFNQGWPDPSRPVARYATWRPMYDPFTFMNLVIRSDGALSRYRNAVLDAQLEHAATEADPGVRNRLYQEVGKMLKDDPAAIYLWNITANYVVSERAKTWTPRGDQYVLPMSRRGA